MSLYRTVPIGTKASEQFPVGWVLSAWSVWLVIEFFAFGGASVIIWSDNANVTVPNLLSKKFAGLSNPLWDRFSAGGIDEWAGADHALLNIFLFNIFPGWLAHAIHISSQKILAIIGVYFLMRKTFHVTQAAAVFSAIAYSAAFHPYMFSSVHGFAPIVLLAMTALFENPKSFWRWGVMIGAVLLITWTSFFSRLIPYASILIFFWFALADPRKRLGEWSIILLVCLAIPLLKLKDILALVATSPFSHAGYIRISFDWTDILVDFFVSPFFLRYPVPVICMALFVFALFLERSARGRNLSLLAYILLGAGLLSAGLTLIQQILISFFPFIAGYSFVYFAPMDIWDFPLPVG